MVIERPAVIERPPAIERLADIERHAAIERLPRKAHFLKPMIVTKYLTMSRDGVLCSDSVDLVPSSFFGIGLDCHK
jgi:hypothetical protein